MRASCRANDPGFSTWVKHRPLTIFLDGVEQTEVVTADDVEGIVVKLRRDERGEYVLNAKRDAVETEELRGRVEIRFRS